MDMMALTGCPRSSSMSCRAISVGKGGSLSWSSDSVCSRSTVDSSMPQPAFQVDGRRAVLMCTIWVSWLTI